MKKQFSDKKSFEISSINTLADGERTFKAIANKLNEVDSDGDIFSSKAFDRQLQKRDKFPLLYNHQSNEIIGFCKTWTDESNLHMEATLFDGTHARANEVHTLLKNGALADLSIGFFVEPDAYKKIKKNEHGGLTFSEVGLREISVVLVGANRSSVVTEVKEMSRKDIELDEEIESEEVTETETQDNVENEDNIESTEETKTMTLEERLEVIKKFENNEGEK